MNLEVIKLSKQRVGDSEGWVISLEDFTRLISKHKLTLRDLQKIGISRSLWDNTLAYHGYNVNSVQGLRERPYKESRHGNSPFGFSTIISPKEGNYANTSKIQGYLAYLEKHFPGITLEYSKYHDDPNGVSKILGEYNKEVLELGLTLKYIHHRVRKWAVRTNKPYQKLIHSKLNISFSKLLDDIGISYLPEYRIKTYFFDFYLPEYGVFIEVDGGGHKGENDRVKDALVSLPHKLLRFKVRDRQQLIRKYDTIKDKISKACGL